MTVVQNLIDQKKFEKNRNVRFPRICKQSTHCFRKGPLKPGTTYSRHNWHPSFLLL